MNTIERHVLELIGENTASPDVFTDDADGMAPVRDSINDAIEEISLYTGLNKKTYYVSLRQNRTFYRFRLNEGSLLWVTDVWLRTQKRRLEQTSLIKLINFNPRWLYNTGTPQAYFPVGFNFFGIWPRPSSDTDLLEITMALAPQRYTADTDRIQLRKNWEWAAAHYAVGEFYAGRGDAKNAIYHHNKYLGRMGINLQYPAASERQWRLDSEKATWQRKTA